MTDHRVGLADRVRNELTSQPSVREVSMFGSLAFMVNEKMAVAAGGDGALLVRVDPARSPELMALPRAGAAEWERVGPWARAGSGSSRRG